MKKLASMACADDVEWAVARAGNRALLLSADADVSSGFVAAAESSSTMIGTILDFDSVSDNLVHCRHILLCNLHLGRISAA